MTREPLKARLLRIVWRLSGHKGRVDQFLAGFLKYRKYLPECDAADIIPGFSGTEVRLRQCPLGAWSTPLVDVYVVLKAALGFQSRRILELGTSESQIRPVMCDYFGASACNQRMSWMAFLSSTVTITARFKPSSLRCFSTCRSLS